jgi:site-specific recombinase XerD
MSSDEKHTHPNDERGAEVSLVDVLEDYLSDKGKGREDESGQYRRHAEREVNRLIEFLAKDRSMSSVTFKELSVGDLREYARYLSRQGWTEGTVQNYYAHVSGFCGWAAREGYLSGNIAQRAGCVHVSKLLIANVLSIKMRQGKGN